MKRCILLALALSLLVLPALGQWRLDVGVMVPRGTGLVIGGSDLVDFEGFSVADMPFIPFPEAGLHYVGELGPLRLGLGARAYTLILETIFWPNAFLELESGRTVLELQFGGGLFGMFGILPTQFHAGKVFIPDLSAWYKLGRKQNLRLGVGLLGVYVPELFGEALPFLLYLGGKLAVPL